MFLEHIFEQNLHISVAFWQLNVQSSFGAGMPDFRLFCHPLNNLNHNLEIKMVS